MEKETGGDIKSRVASAIPDWILDPSKKPPKEEARPERKPDVPESFRTRGRCRGRGDDSNHNRRNERNRWGGDTQVEQGDRRRSAYKDDDRETRPAKRPRDFSHLMSADAKATGEEDSQPKWGKDENDDLDSGEVKEVEKANFGLSGALAKDSQTGNVYNGVLLKWSEPVDARRPTKRWRFYVFKGGDIIQTLHIHRQSAYLVGREKKIADILVEHPSCSKQHAVIQFRLKESLAADGVKKIREVRPYVLDLESTNGTFLNGKRVESSRYVELLEKDMLKFGESTREYILLPTDSADE